MKIIKAIREQKKEKCPGPNGISSEYYQFCEDLIIDPMFDLLLDIFQGNQIPDTWRASNTILLPKEGKDVEEIQNYRPITLLNVDYKIYATANRLKGLLPHTIHQDQNGFAYGRQLKNNIRILVNAIEVYHQSSEKQAAFFS